MPNTRKENEADLPTTKVDFGVRDAKGRAVGFIIYGSEFDTRLAKEGESWYCTHYPLGHVYELRGISTRDGGGFGSAMIYLHGTDLAALHTEMEKRVERARKIAVKKFTK